MSRMPRGSRPLVGSSRTSRRGARSKRGGEPEPLAHAERIRAYGAVVDACQPNALESFIDARLACAPRRTRSGRVEQSQIAAAG